MGCDAVRTSHNMPTPELVELCDEMGFMMMLEPFDEWDIAKCENGYHRYFNEWAEKDMVNMLHHYRNNPCVVMWSIGNEVPTQCSPEGYKVASFLQDICHREDPTRPVTCGMDQVTCVLANGFAAMIDVPGLNYRAHRYVESYETLPQNIVLGSETASTVSSRGVYKFPVQKGASVMYDDHQCSGYDVECCSWSNLPDEDFALADDYDWTIGQFVWTGFDYLGEPSPYSTDSWPSHSSVFGIIDLAGLPKDRFYLYRSLWNKQANTLHVLPHWTWPGREGENTPVFVYTSYPSAELFVNGKSYGKQRKLTADESRVLVKAGAVMRRYHDSGLEFKTSFDPVAKIDEYKAILDEHSYGKRYEGWERMVEALERIRAAYAKQPPRRVPCHNDALAENFMLQGEQMRVIDWEYGGMNDGYYDIACVCVENPLDAHCEDVFFRAYCGGEPSEEAKARLLINKFLVTSHWSTWSLVQICYGKDAEFYWEYGRTRAVQACSFLDDPSFSRSLTLLGG